jgi:hypothetical protein
LVQGVGVLAGVVSIAGSVLATWTQVLSVEWLSVLLALLIVGLLFVGGFSWLDHLNKIMMAVLALATVLAFLPIIPGPEAWKHLVTPALPAGSVVLVAAMLGWMPTGIDVSVWHSFWTIEKIKQLEPGEDRSPKRTPDEQLRTSLLDMRIGYGLSLASGLMFVTMGAVHLAGQGEALKGAEFAQELSLAYTNILGRWMYHVFMLTAFFAMFSTSYTVIDGFSRSFSECCAVLFSPLGTPGRRRRIYFGFVIASALLACAILLTLGSRPVMLVTAAALVSLTAAPLLYGFNLYCVLCHVEDPRMRPPGLSVSIAFAGIVFMLLALGVTVYVKLLLP